MSNITKRRTSAYNNPMSVLDGFFNDNFLDGFFIQPTRNKSNLLTDVKTRDNGYEISLAIPGVPKEDVNVDLNNNTLTVSYNTTSETTNALTAGSFKKTWTLPEGVDAELITATSKDGILTVDVPTTKEATLTRNIAIK